MKRLIVLGLLAGTVAATAATPSRPEKRRPVTSSVRKKPAARRDPVDALVAGLFVNSVTDRKALYTACLDANVKALLWGLEGTADILDQRKGEFETSDEFGARAARLDAALNGERDILICQDLSDNEDAPFTYDADSQTFTGTFDSRLRADLDWKPLGTYRSRTRMGVGATVRSFLDIEYLIDMAHRLPTGASCVSATDYQVVYKVPVPRADAPATKRSAYLAITGRLMPPYFTKTHTSGNPTLDHPSDIDETDLTASLRPTRLAIVMPGNRIVWECAL